MTPTVPSFGKKQSEEHSFVISTPTTTNKQRRGDANKKARENRQKQVVRSVGVTIDRTNKKEEAETRGVKSDDNSSNFLKRSGCKEGVPIVVCSATRSLKTF